MASYNLFVVYQEYPNSREEKKRPKTVFHAKYDTEFEICTGLGCTDLPEDVPFPSKEQELEGSNYNNQAPFGEK